MAKREILNIPQEYLDAAILGKPLFPILFQFENGLRLAIHKFLAVCYGEDWWEKTLKGRLPRIYDYVEDQKKKMSFMPWIGDTAKVQLLPIHSITLGQLEQIVITYQSDCIPELFPTLDFFTGHIFVIKRVRNLFAHMYPCVGHNDVEIARNEIDTLSKHLKDKL